MMRDAPSRLEASTAQRPTAPSPTTTTVLPSRHAGRDGRVVAGAHHVREREQARDELLRRVFGRRDERAVGERNAHLLALAAVGEGAELVVGAPPAAVLARGADAVAAVHAGVVAVVERGDHEVADATFVTFGPTSSTTPTNSWPMRCGSWVGVTPR